LALVWNFLLIILGFALLIKGADFLVSGASSLAKKFKVPEIAIGLTIVAMGTSAPEMVVNVISSANDYYGVVFGNIIGSNIFNVLMIMGIAGTIYPLTIQTNTVWKEIPFSLIATLILLILVNDVFLFGAEKNEASLGDGILLLILFVTFLLYVFLNLKRKDDVIDEEIEEFSVGQTTLYLIVGVIGLGLGGHLVVDNAVDIAAAFDLSEKMVGLTILAAGTSLPELATTSVAAFRKRSDIAVGNIIGSNIFNILLVLGVSSIISPLEFETILNIDIFVLLAATLLLFIFNFTLNRKRIDRWEAILFLVGFIGYMIYLFIRK